MSALPASQLALSAEADIAFSVPIAPRGWARARKNGNRFFKDEATAAFEWAIGTHARVTMRGRAALDGALSLTVISILPIPPSWSKRRRASALAGDIRPTGKPDWDNLGKGVSDALNGIVWTDDAQVVDGRSLKFYGAEPAVQIAVHSINFQPQSTGRPGGTVFPSEGALERSTASG